ncbi:50S ribosomal protein L3 N(5)-glutamine methyltransferase [Halioglobus maricola]|uniref:50S ribosomal protein L3 N(5)-glutamine methyltransferase n=1 Tax=Halioglobus maricola TaxID=2601894 RepID=A0A5P9NKC8_9GAMM|nr:50S ribosomal protein L3 N(5)-glutamine methyltransferase [Halioglobus maricola]QFU76049.1 50S ribosomal protein L3 N(5)-glutamine methyltransferase [Halioglobus maricola]
MTTTTVGQAIEHCHDALIASDVFYGHGTDNPWDEAVQLVLAVSDLPADADEAQLPHPVSDGQWRDIQALLRRRIDERVPLPYLIGKAWFAGLEFSCDHRALVPRSPLAELILHDYQPWYRGPTPSRILDLCCGGGCIGLAAAYYAPEVSVDLVDLDSEALALAAENVARMGLEGRVRTIQSNGFAALGGKRYDVILCNPPYVDAGDLASMPAEYHHEPELGLGSGHDGLDLTRQILAQVADHLEPSGLLILEVGNSWTALDAAYPDVAFTWLEFEHGGHGVLALTAQELQEYAASLRPEPV